MARKAREVKSAAPSPSPARELSGENGTGSSRSRSRSTHSARSKLSEEISTAEDTADETVTDLTSQATIPEEPEEEVELEEAEEEDADHTAEQADGGEKEGASGGKLSMAERMAKMKELRMRMNQSSVDNRKDLVADHQKSKVTAKELLRLEKQRKLAQTLRLKAEAEATGEDMERKKNWEYNIEQNEKWEAKMQEQAAKQDHRFHNAEDDAWKRYNRNLKSTKPDLVSYERQKEAALGLAPGTLVPAGATSSQLAAASSSRSGALTAHEDFYRGADTLAYGDSKPSEDAIDRVMQKINKDLDKGKRKKKEEDDGEVTYINHRNKKFNQKVSRYFDKYTKEIKANFERGTAL